MHAKALSDGVHMPWLQALRFEDAAAEDQMACWEFEAQS